MAHPFRFGVVSGGRMSPDAWIKQAQRLEELGYSSLLMPDRPIMAGLAPLTALATAAAVTQKLRVGSYVFAVGLRHPALLAREFAALDQFSGGRTEFGLGAGTSDSDFDQLGLPFGSPGERVSQVEEAVQIIKGVFTADKVDFAGKYYNLKGFGGTPGVQSPHPPLIIGSASKRMLSLAGREAQIAAPARKWSPRGEDPNDAPLEEKVGWVRDAAGDRFDEIELARTIFYMELSDGPSPVQAQAGGPPVGANPLTTDAAIAHIQELRERYGFTYFQVYEGQLENFSPVVAQLSGK